MTPMRMKPVCATELYASMRFTSVWVTASSAPITIVAMATAHIIGRQSHSTRAKAM